MRAIVPRVHFLYTSIGRGHPFYLDGILQTLLRRRQIRLVRGQDEVFELSRGMSFYAWKLARTLYRHGGDRGPLGKLYGLIRSGADYNRPSRFLDLLARDVRRHYRDQTSPVVVAHPILVAALRGRKDLIYQHGEAAAPPEALVRGASLVLVPLPETAEAFVAAGYPAESVSVTGLCVEPSLAAIAADAFEKRLNRIEGGEPLTGAFYTSGAEPPSHVALIAEAACSAAHKGGRALVFAQAGGRLARVVTAAFGKAGIELGTVDASQGIGPERPSAVLVQFANRREETVLTGRLFSDFDYFVAPAHERSNWALGLGLPMFMLGPDIGSYAPLNAKLLGTSQVVERLESRRTARGFGVHVNRLRTDGALGRRARAGWGRLAISGFDRIAELLIARYGGLSL